MLLLFGSLPLSGVFAEVNQDNASVEESESVEGVWKDESESVENVCKEEAESEKNVCEEDSELAENIREDESEDIENTSEEELDTVESEQEYESESAEGTWEQDDEQVDEIESTQEGTEEPESTQEEKSQIQLQASIEKEGHFSYREDYGRSVLLSFFVDKLQRETGIYLTVTTTNEGVIKPRNEQELYSFADGYILCEITGAGEAELILRLVENEFYEAEEIRVSVVVTDSMLREEDYAIYYTCNNTEEMVRFHNFAEWEQFLKQHQQWLNGTINVELTDIGEMYYEEINMQKEFAQELWQGKRYCLLEEAPIQSYEFWCSNSQTHTSTEEVENGKRIFLVGIDKKPPKAIEFSYSQNAYQETSTKTIKYYSEDFIISGAFEDSLSGVARIEYTTQADLGEAAKWKTIQQIEQDGNRTVFEFVLGQGIYTGIAVRAVDVAGNVSEMVELKNEDGDFLHIIVDNREPILDIMLKTQDEMSYEGKWTNQAITIAVQENTENQLLSGIQSIQYQYVSIGGEYQQDQWQEFQADNQIKIGNKENAKMNQNGTYYFRAISNTGVVTEIETQKKKAVRIRLQQSLPEKQEKIEEAPALNDGQEWYNKKTGVPFLSFAYPQYDAGIESLEYGAPITVHARLTRKQGENKDADKNKAEIIDKSVTIGMRNDEEYQQLMHIENDKIEQNREEYIREQIQQNIEALNIDFAYNSQTGYAQDGIYELEYWISDVAGNESEHAGYIYKIDTHEPQNLEVFVDGMKMQEDTSQNIHYDRFYQSTVSGNASADFGVSGKSYIKLMLTDETGISANSNGWQESDEFVINPCERGCIYMLAEDMAGNQAILKTQGIVVDNQAPVGEYGGKFIHIQTEANENHFYKDDVKLSFSADDLPQDKGFSGIESFSYVVGTAGKEKEQRKELFSFTKALPSQEELISAKIYGATEMIDAVTFEGNDTYIEVTVQDRCGNVATSREELRIDVTVPQVEITFDLNEPKNGKYYNRTRTATIQIQELNFDGNRVKIEVTKDGEVYPVSISEWQSDGNCHWAPITFSENGDYTMSVTCTDLADNVSEKVSIEPFTVDVTKPEVEIAYDNHNVKNECYYQTRQTATISVKEHNFSEEDFVLIVEPQVAVGKWSHKGDEHYLELYFTEDNHYRFQCSVADLAGNEAEAIEEQEFYIDSVAPQIVIHGVEDDSANKGEIAPVVMVYDENRSIEGTDIAVTTGLDELIPVSVQTQETEQGYSYLLTDMSQKEDNVYFLEVTASDMAGNISTLTYRFSLNRHGSTYDLSNMAQLTERFYYCFNQLSDLCITEMNVDEIEEYAFYITRNGKMLTCMEISEQPKEFSEDEEVLYYVEKEGDERKGYKNYYFFPRENFEKEGIYRIICYSKDRAGNESNNTLEDKKAEISFVIDNTAPKVVVNGMDDGGIYNEEEHLVNVMVQDNFLLSKAVFSLITESGEVLQSWDYIELVRHAGDTMTITIPSREEKQYLVYEISDAAGNELVLLPDTEEAPKGFLVTTNLWLRFISSPVKVAVAVMILVIICVSAVYGILHCIKKTY